MSSGPNPWTSIADLLSGFVVVLLLLFVTAALLPHFQQKADAEVREDSRNAFVTDLKQRLAAYEKLGLVHVNADKRLIEFSDVSFASASACLTPAAISAVDTVAPALGERLSADPTLSISVEGHTDPEPVHGLVNACGWFDNNTQLSTLRAANVRDRIVLLASDAKSRLPVTGWGSDQLKNVALPFAPENRRVELLLRWRDENGEGARVSPPTSPSDITSRETLVRLPGPVKSDGGGTPVSSVPRVSAEPAAAP